MTGFRATRPTFTTPQAELLDWLAEAHATSAAARDGLDRTAREALRDRIRRVIDRCACPPAQIRQRSHALADVGSTAWADHVLYDLDRHPSGRGSDERSRLFDQLARDYMEAAFADDDAPPRDLIHVTCTGYVSPSPAQRLVDAKGWSADTRVTHAYQMGCYAALPALRLAAGALLTPAAFASTRARPRVDVVHTELCSLHLDPGVTSMEQLVVQSLFADGLIRYHLTEAPPATPSLRVLALAEQIVPDSADAMAWVVSDHGMRMALARDVPERIAGGLRAFVIELYGRAGLDLGRDLPRSAAAVHPGGPRILDRVGALLELGAGQLAASREVLREHGNMSSATLPHVWMRIVDDPSIPAGTPVLSLAFGPGLTLCGGLLRKE